MVCRANQSEGCRVFDSVVSTRHLSPKHFLWAARGLTSFPLWLVRWAAARNALIRLVSAARHNWRVPQRASWDGFNRPGAVPASQNLRALLIGRGAHSCRVARNQPGVNCRVVVRRVSYTDAATRHLNLHNRIGHSEPRLAEPTSHSRPNRAGFRAGLPDQARERLWRVSAAGLMPSNPT